jgi:hypothetical protein
MASFINGETHFWKHLMRGFHKLFWQIDVCPFIMHTLSQCVYECRPPLLKKNLAAAVQVQVVSKVLSLSVNLLYGKPELWLFPMAVNQKASN